MIRKLLSSQPHSIDWAALVLRIFIAGFMIYSHGYGKLMKWDELKVDFAEPFGIPAPLSAALTIFAEFFCSVLILAGLFTRLASIPVIICMAIAAFNIHAGQPLGKSEAALTYMACFIAIFLAGPGKYSLDYLLWRK